MREPETTDLNFINLLQEFRADQFLFRFASAKVGFDTPQSLGDYDESGTTRCNDSATEC